MAAESTFFQIAIDGPSGVGKSTTASKLAARLNFTRIDSGTLYRALTYILLDRYKYLDRELILAEESAISQTAFKMAGDAIIYNGENIKPHLREAQIDRLVSVVARVPYVREKIKNMQHALINAINSGVIIDGRDIGTVILPRADLKIFLTAKEEIRAQRRWVELGRRGSYEDLYNDMVRRDYEDINRKVGPLKQADDAVIVDNSDLTLDGQVDLIYNMAMERINKRGKL